ncbi:hypothetical protein AJ80_01902 [Polytolypa hystricis UAMH7299]|uniref:N-acetyltransferase domain-containing protein n=1 Tax=Polytolypa hystricis (strain UAMH7299) TaxID=1447883 RepID=A0A2B7YQW4_POLH7|nr:hypothetical protein AJ80_01902 [Polytolypa hystricis UAMH7299]
MAYSFFANASKGGPISISPLPVTTNKSNKDRRNSLDQTSSFRRNILSSQPASLVPPPPAAPAPVKQPSSTDPAFQPTPYPHSPESAPTPHPNVTINPVKTAHIPSLMRITGLLLPVRYPNSFYTSTITDPIISSLSRVAIYHDHPVSEVSATAFSTSADKVIGGIRCRLEPVPSTTAPGAHPKTPTNLYIQTLHLLAPYRGSGIAVSLLNSLIYKTAENYTSPTHPPPVSATVKHYNIRTVTAHVHESNEEALQWYTARSFALQDGVVEGYYRRLKPGGAKIVKLELSWDDETRTSDEDDDWEKVEVEEGNGAERLEDYDTLDLEENVRKRPKK